MTVNVDSTVTDFGVSSAAYFPDYVTVHPGDTIDFTLQPSGDPHTVTFGSLVDVGLKKAREGDSGEEPLELVQIPDLIPAGAFAVSQGTAQPCFLKTGGPPRELTAACPQMAQPEFDGSYSVYNSGWLDERSPFSVKFAASVKPGAYSFFCALHRAGMTGVVNVVPAAQRVPSPADVAANGATKLGGFVDGLRDAYREMQSLAPARGQAGGYAERVLDASISEFGPAQAKLKVGQSMTWTFYGSHTISFNVARTAPGLREQSADGAVRVNPKLVDPVRSAGMPRPVPTTAGTTVIDGGSWDGSGPKSSGLVYSRPPALRAYRLTFTRPGTYSYVCLVHPRMDGRVVVG
ncbi:MAG: hypothetical protein ABR520_01800 [Mycobacteriales bacterium]